MIGNATVVRELVRVVGVVVTITVVPVVVAGCIDLVMHEAAVDGCLDRGGRWDYERGRCEEDHEPLR